MFLNLTQSGYTRDGSHFAQGPFLMVVQDHTDTTSRRRLRAVVRHVRMSQCGHFMMGQVTLGGIELTLSGTYGNDGLPIHLPNKHGIASDDKDAALLTSIRLLRQMVEVPAELCEAFWNGGGHNTGGSETPLLRKWAKENLAALRRPIRSVGPISVNLCYHEATFGDYVTCTRLNPRNDPDYFSHGPSRCLHFVALAGIKAKA